MPRGYSPPPHPYDLKVWFPGKESIKIGGGRSLFPRLIRGTLCWIEAPEDGGEQAITQEMPEMRPFPGRIAELDGYTYPSFGRAEVAFDIVRVMGGTSDLQQSGPSAASGSAPAAQAEPSCTAPNPNMSSPSEDNTSPSGDEEDRNEENRQSPDPS